MAKKNNSSAGSFSLISWILLVPLIANCSLKPEVIKVMALDPMSHTCISCYPNIDAIYESDDEIVLISSWDGTVKNQKLATKWEIRDERGKVVWASEIQKVTIRPNVYFTFPLNLDTELKNKLTSGNNSLNIYIEGKLADSQILRYVPQNIQNKKINGAVILPFSLHESEVTLLAADSINNIRNTIACAIYAEVKRSIPDTVPHYVAEQRTGGLLEMDCYDNKDCIDKVKAIFDKEIIISGRVTLPKYENDMGWLDLAVYNVKTGETIKFSATPPGAIYYDELIHDMLEEMLYRKGLANYIRAQ